MSGVRFFLCVLLFAVGGCVASEDVQPVESGQKTEVVPLVLHTVDSVIVDGGSLLIEVQGVELLIPTQAHVALRGHFNATPAGGELTVVPETLMTNDGKLLLSVPWDTLLAFEGFARQGSFTGQLQVAVDDVSLLAQGIGVAEVAFEFVPSLTPSIALPPHVDIYLNSDQIWPSSGLLRVEEGESFLEVIGTFEKDQGAVHNVSATVAIQPGPSGRGEADLRWAPHLFGLEPGQFTGEVWALNRGQAGTETRARTPLTSVRLMRTTLLGFDPPEASRGQMVQAIGRGFIKADGGLGQAMFFELEGLFTGCDGFEQEWREEQRLRLLPDAVLSHQMASVAFRTELGELGGLDGLTAQPGTFVGSITPILLDRADTVRGEPWEGSLTITPTQQVVYLRLLPGYIDALQTFGLRNVEPEIRAAMFAILKRDYAGINIMFTDQKPKHWLEYTVVEVGGEDPNGAGLLGLDNTMGHDVGNRRLDDVIGGQNAESRDRGELAFGGVFVQSFSRFSPTIAPENALASPSFDRLFGPFMPELGGRVVDASEASGEEGRRNAIDAAVRAMGSLIGHTISHEVGHALGLAVDSNDVHNATDEPGSIMDEGRYRSFEERCSLEGAPISQFNARNRIYLETILPR